MSEIPNRVVGSEMEWPVLMREGEGKLARDDSSITEAIMRGCLPEGILRLGAAGMMSNGSRLYNDLRFFEYATPEDNRLKSAVANEIAGERIMTMMMEKAVRVGKISGYVVNKRVLDDMGKTWGYHTSFSADGTKLRQTEALMMPIAMHLATQNIYAGAGAIWRHGEYAGQSAMYALAQKVSDLNCNYNMQSHGAPSPLVSLKSENLTSDKSIRVHLTSMDANISPWATWMRLGTTSIVLRLMENGYAGNDVRMHDMVHMYKFATEVAKDQTLSRSVRLHDGSRARALDIQRTLYENATQIELSEDELAIMPEWKRALDDLEENPDRLIDRADWVLRRHIIRRFMDQQDLPLYDDLVAFRDREYDNIDPVVGLGQAFRQKGVFKQWMPSEAMIENAIYNPPETTRAKGRAALIREHYTTAHINANWDYVTLSDKKIKYTFPSPLQVEPVIQELKTPPAHGPYPYAP